MKDLGLASAGIMETLINFTISSQIDPISGLQSYIKFFNQWGHIKLNLKHLGASEESHIFSLNPKHLIYFISRIHFIFKILTKELHCSYSSEEIILHFIHHIINTITVFNFNYLHVV